MTQLPLARDEAAGVARALRGQSPGAIYHVLSRGDRREEIVRDDEDRAVFVAALEQASARTDWQVHAWCCHRP